MQFFVLRMSSKARPFLEHTYQHSDNKHFVTRIAKFHSKQTLKHNKALKGDTEFHYLR